MDRVKKLLGFLEDRYGRPETCQDPFGLLITTVLSQRTRDQNTERAAARLFHAARSPKALSRLPLKRIETLIRPSGPYRQKALRIKEISRIVEHKGMPDTRNELMKLPGVGYKTADIVLSYGFGIPTIAVDTHVNRIPKRIGIVDEKANVEQVREQLEKIIKGEDRFIVNMGLVRFGQEVCRPVRPKCNECPLKKICRYNK